VTDPFDAAKSTAYAARGSYAGVPARPLDDLGDAGVVILGAPLDWGAYLGFDGSRPHLPTGIDALDVLNVVDAGDLLLPIGYLERSIDLIGDAVERIARHGAVPIILGGDHSITWPNARAVAAVHGDIALIHFDAHADTGNTAPGGVLLGHGTPMRRLIESGAVAGHRFVQIGLRGYWPEPETVEWMDQQGMRTYLMSEIVDRGLKAVVADAVAYAAAGADAVFLSVDIDVVDPGMAPGTGTPEPGGLTSRELLDTLRRLARELNVVGADVVEVSPPYDGPGEVTAFLANRCVLEVLNGMAERKLV
jgi:agmatinase